MDSYENYGITLPNGRTSGEVATTCPKCSPDRKPKNQKAKCLGVNLDKKVWRCNHCSWAGALRLDRDEVKVYQKPVWKNKTELSADVVKFFESRKISQATLIEAKITDGMEWMPQVSKEVATIQFNYFRNGELINTKYRAKGKAFKLFKDAELIFYNLDSLQGATDVYIVEGEMDCLALIESGLKCVLSVPNGANLNSNKTDYLDSSIDLFNGVNIHLAFDNDPAGRKLRDEIADRFGKERCDYIEFKDCKDANECLIKYGKRGVMECIESPLKFPLVGAYTISDFDHEIEDIYLNGLDKGIGINLEGFDLSFVKGYITVITGIPSHGKSDFLDHICLKLKLIHGCKGAFYSPENKPTQLHFSKMARKLIGKPWDGFNRITPEEKNLVKRFLDGQFWFIKPEKDFTLTSILAKVRELQVRHGLDFFVIDAWNKLEHKGKADTEYVGRCLDELAVFCETHNLHLFLVAHPTKMPKEDNGKYQVPTLYNISGSSNFYNKADNGICVYRDFETGLTTVYRQKIKFDHWGTEGYFEYRYHIDSKRYYSTVVPDLDNWITKDEQLKQFDLPKLNPELTFENNEPAPF